jgi:uncharacterized membrane protein
MLQSGIRALVALSFISVGCLHFSHDHLFVLLMPPYLPWHHELVWLSGVFEILGGIGLMVPQTRRFSAWGLLALLIAVFPANIHMALYSVELPVEFLPQSEFGRWVRLPFQFVFAGVVWWVGLRKPGGELTDAAEI